MANQLTLERIKELERDGWGPMTFEEWDALLELGKAALKQPRITLEQAQDLLDFHSSRYGNARLQEFILLLEVYGIEVESAPPEVKV